MLKFFLPLLALLAASLPAQSIRWEPGSGTLALNQLSELSLIFDQCEPKGDVVTLPAVPGLTFNQPPNRSQQTSVNVVNFKATTSKTITLTYRVRPSNRGPVTIPAFQIDTDKGRQTVSSATFEIGDATVGQSSLSLESIVQSRFTLPPGQVWTGEVFPLTYSLNAARRYLYQLGSDPEWNPAPLGVEPWSKPEQLETTVNNESRVSIVYKTRAYAKAPGTVALAPATQLVNLATGSSSFTVFSRPSIEQFAITSQPATLAVKPLPSPATAGFSGAVGQFTLDSKVVPATATVGEPITWTLTLDGTGNWPDIAGLPARSVSKDFRIVQPQAKRAAKGNALFDASITEDIVLIPTKPGAYTLGPIAFSIFNPATGAYETLTTKPVTITVGGTTSVSSVAPPADPQLKLPPSTSSAPAAAAPAALPRDPLPSSGAASAPLSSTAVLIGLLTSVLGPLSLWLILARRRALATDPARPLREAHARLTSTLRQLAEMPKPESGNLKPETPNSPLQVSSLSPQVSSLLQHWQRDTAILWCLPQAVPTPASFLVGLDLASGRSGTGHSNGGEAAVWSALWSEADRTLYGAAPLPADWAARAQAALAARPAPVFSSFQLFIPRNLLPLLALTFLLVGGRTSVSAADSSGERQRPDPSTATSAYAKADFPAAEAAWRDALKTAPTDWTAHHNLALTLLQQNHANDAAGHALAAFVQQPQNPSVRWHLGYAWKTAGVTPVALKPFLTDAPLASLARLASPARWQTALIASAWLGALALALGVWAAYRKHPSACCRHWSLIIGHWSFRCALGTAALLLAAAAGLSLKTYGALADTRAVVVVTATTLRSIPTDLDTPQKSTPLAIGVIAATDKAFLGWRRLVFPDGQTGWVRAETLVPLWR